MADSVDAVRSVGRPRRTTTTGLIRTTRLPSERDVNILLLGQSGVGKTTTINAFVNYLSHSSLAEARRHEVTAIIPSSFNYDDGNEDLTIRIGNEDQNEQFSMDGRSATQTCRSFVFPIGDRNLRIIDTPGIGDTRGPGHDDKNFEEILRFISQFNHLNAICVLFKPEETRMNILFRFCINELLRHLDSSAKHNLIFLFTNGRVSFYRPGQSRRLIARVLEEHRKKYHVEIPFTTDNTFVVDNESFRYLVLCQNGIVLDDDQVNSYNQSWQHSVKEYQRFLTYVLQRPVHHVNNFVSLNTAEQLIRKLPRPLAETQRLIEQNIQLAQQHRQRVIDNPEILEEGLPQLAAQIVQLPYPRTVCASDECSRIITVDGVQRRDYSTICHDHCYLKGVAQEALIDEKLQECEAFHPHIGKSRDNER